MGDSRVKMDLDPAYVWFPNSKFAITYCKTVAYGNKCKFFQDPDMCVLPGFEGNIAQLKYCPCCQFDLESWETLKPMKNYDIIRGYNGRK